MSDNSFTATVDLTLAPSQRALRIAFVLHAICLGLIPFSMDQGTPMLLLIAAVGLSWLYVRRHPALGFGPAAITRVVWHADGNWHLHRARGEPAPAQLLPGSIVLPWMLLLRFRLDQGGTCARLLLGDEADPRQLRQLRARLGA